MGNSQDPPSLEELGEGDELPAYWAEDTTITCQRYTKERLNEIRDGTPWDQFLEQLRREHADPLTFRNVEEIADFLADELAADGETRVTLEPTERKAIAREVAEELR